jgi:hypothetical protein
MMGDKMNFGGDTYEIQRNFKGIWLWKSRDFRLDKKKFIVESAKIGKRDWIEWTVAIMFDELVAVITASDGKEPNNALLLKGLDRIFSKEY